jgi:hypothetical protein
LIRGRDVHASTKDRTGNDYLVNDLAIEAAEEAERRGINLVAADAIDKVESFKFLGSFEDQFYETMQKIIERHRAEADKS